jgi:GNAT superfamily N-acetyltransferase
VVLRTIRPDDKELLRAGFRRLSPESRYLRFHGVKTELSDAELRYLTEVDGVDHFALGAVRHTDGGDEGVGVARLVRLTTEPGVGEAAITVLDDLQGQGLGTILFQRIVAAAAERGIVRIRSLVLGSNKAMQEMLRRLAGDDAQMSVEQGVVTVDIELPRVRVDAPADEAPRESGLYELLRLAARRILSLRPGAGAA